MLTLVVIFCLLNIAATIELLQFNEDSKDYPLTYLKSISITWYLWTLTACFLLISMVLRAQYLVVVAYVAILYFGTNSELSLQGNAYTSLAVVCTIVSATLFWRIINSQSLRRQLCGKSTADEIQQSKVSLQRLFFGRVKEVETVKQPNSVFHKAYMIFGNAISSVIVTILFSSFVFTMLLFSFKSGNNIVPFYLFFYPLIPLCFPVFKADPSLSPFLPVSRKEQFINMLMLASRRL